MDLVSCIRLFGGTLLEVAIQLHGAMEDANDVDLALVWLDVHDPVMPPHQDARCPTGFGQVALARLRKLLQHLYSRIDGLDHVERRCRLVQGDVVVDLEKPALGFMGPDYFRQDSIRRAISSFEIVRPVSESAMPLSTMAANASSRSISSWELSSGWSSMRRISSCFAVLMVRYSTPRTRRFAALPRHVARRVKPRSANTMMLPFFLMQLRFAGFNDEMDSSCDSVGINVPESLLA